jgi:hypothetical protein
MAGRSTPVCPALVRITLGQKLARKPIAKSIQARHKVASPQIALKGPYAMAQKIAPLRSDLPRMCGSLKLPAKYGDRLPMRNPPVV